MKAAFIACTLGVLGTLNWMIVDKEVLLDSAESVYLELAPVDPRSLMQGDYMILRYAVTSEAFSQVPAQQKSGRLVLRLDARRVGHLARIDNGQPPGPNEVAIRFTRNHRVEIGAESFFFEEGMGDLYASAKFAELKVAPDGTCVLTSLLDENLRTINP
jgi:uncharacterized membrane-anchored protein